MCLADTSEVVFQLSSVKRTKTDLAKATLRTRMVPVRAMEGVDEGVLEGVVSREMDSRRTSNDQG